MGINDRLCSSSSKVRSSTSPKKRKSLSPKQETKIEKRLKKLKVLRKKIKSKERKKEKSRDKKNTFNEIANQTSVFEVLPLKRPNSNLHNPVFEKIKRPISSKSAKISEKSSKKSLSRRIDSSIHKTKSVRPTSQYRAN